ncbi:contact-dependent growth inhibition system immunity protein [Jannaschia sp. S6380]|uniref:contact-dependent growth inhibition system immunity protein n=1 Tax=Jannaschia sp. S6380 TaxID=2926408 RepID=UPI001FF263A3|nr:contact-dependent growth inhibition system immunity protein [Jannaschia sp. S6380]MCK0167062.1 contact-dependent growth inhibition system immunity protein [Jannaschia sp. S6380]
MDDREKRVARLRERMKDNPSWQRMADKSRREAEERRRNAKPLAERREASIDLFRQFVRVRSQAVYTLSCPDPEGYRAFLDADVDGPTLVRHTRAALAASRFIRPDHPEFDRLIRFPGPAEMKALEAENLARAGVKTRGALYRDAAHLAIRLQDAQIDLRPMRYRRAATWEGIRGVATVLPEDVDDETFGAAILDAIDTSRAAR